MRDVLYVLRISRHTRGALVTGVQTGALPRFAPDFVATKLGSGAVVPDMAQLDPHAVTVEAPVGATGAQLIALVEEAGRRGTMVSFTFHGIGGDHLLVFTAPHEELPNSLSRPRAGHWVETSLHFMSYLQNR